MSAAVPSPSPDANAPRPRLERRGSERRRRAMRVVRSLLRSPVGLVGFVLVAAAILGALFAPWLAPFDPTTFHFRNRLEPPLWIDGGDPRFLLGTDQLGRDLLSRLLHGARISLVVGFLGVLISLVIGVVLGLIAGYYGGWLDDFLSRVTDTFMAIPFIVLAMSVIAVLGTQGGNSILILVIVLGATGWVTFARVVRGEVMGVKTLEYVEAARALGQNHFWIVLRHVLPNVTASIIVLGTLNVASVIIAESALSFLGLGVQPPTVTWGLMLADGRDHLATSWWLSTFPGLAITFTTLGMIMLGDWLRDVLDPRMQT
jgi:peptide/nickel transport system permease protein